MNEPNVPASATRFYADSQPILAQHPPEEEHLDQSVDVLDDAGARRLNMRAIWILGSSVLVMMALMLWVGRSFGSARTAPALPEGTSETVESPALPGADLASASSSAEGHSEGGGGGMGASDRTLPPMPPEPMRPTFEPSDAYAPPRPYATAASMDDAPVRDTAETSLLQRRILNGASSDTQTSSLTDPLNAETPAVASARDAGRQGKVTRLQHRSFLIVRGTTLRCALASRIVSDLSGYASCVLVEPVYAVDGKRILLMSGTRLLGQYASGVGAGDRLEVQWDRALTPDGLDIALGGAGTDTLGGAGHPGRGSSHWGQRIASALMISILSDGFKYAAAKHGPRETSIYAGGTVVTEPFNSNTAQTAQALAEQALAQGAGRPRTLVIKQGTLLNVYVTEDIDFNDVLGASTVN
jgi:type IV secretion system protein VirB10